MMFTKEEIDDLIQAGKLSLTCEMKEGLPEFKIEIDTINPYNLLITHRTHVGEDGYRGGSGSLMPYFIGIGEVIKCQYVKDLISSTASVASTASEWEALSGALGWGLVLPFRIGSIQHRWELGETVLVESISGTKFFEPYLPELVLKDVPQGASAQEAMATLPSEGSIRTYFRLKKADELTLVGYVDPYYYQQLERVSKRVSDYDGLYNVLNTPGSNVDFIMIARSGYTSRERYKIKAIYAIPLGSVGARRARAEAKRLGDLSSDSPRAIVLKWLGAALRAMAKQVTVSAFLKANPLKLPENAKNKMFVYASYQCHNTKGSGPGCVYFPMVESDDVHPLQSNASFTAALEYHRSVKGTYMSDLILKAFNKQVPDAVHNATE